MRAILPILLLTLAGPAQAHHSLSMYGHAPTTLAGQVEAFHFINPHPYLVLTVSAPAAVAGRWKVELDNRFELEAAGMRADAYRAGERVIVSGRPQTDGTRAMYMQRLERPADGLVWTQVTGSPERVSPGRSARP